MEGRPASPPRGGESSPQTPADLGHHIPDDLHGVAADRLPELPDDHDEHEIGDDSRGDAGDHPPELPGDLEHQIDDEYLGDAGDHPAEPAPPSSSNPVLSDELIARIVKQVEYYFSNENLFNDKFLTRLIKKDKEGFVPIAVIASFRKLKKLSQDLAFIASALSTSCQLTVSSDGKRVKRIQPYPGNDAEDALWCTVLVDNLPEDHSVENVQRIFSSVGNVKNISIRQPYTTSRAPAKNTKKVFAVRGKWHAFVEYETVEAAEKAVLAFNDGGNWRTGMHVQLLVQRTGKHGLASAGFQAASVDNESSMPLDNVGEVLDLTTDDHHDEKPEGEVQEHLPNHRNGGRGHRGTRGRGRGQHYVHHVSGSKGTYVKKHELSASSVEAKNTLDAHDEKLEVGGEHLMNEKDEHKGSRRGRGRNQAPHYHSGRGYKGSSYGNEYHYTGDEHLEPMKGHPETTEVEEHVSGERGGWGGRWRGRGRGHGHYHFDAGQSHGTGSSASSSTCEATLKHPYVPKMPDGTRGFTMGRGRPPSNDTPPS